METARTTLPSFRRKERILLAPGYNGEMHVRFESESLVIRSSSSSNGITHPLVSRDAVELLTKYNALRIRMQVASIASDSFPTSSLDLNDAPPRFAGPSGLMVTVEFSDAVDDGKHRFLALLKELVGKRRILAAPLGSSMQRFRLHRFVETERSGGNSTIVTTVLPMEGSYAALSTEGLRGFLKQASGTIDGIWNVTDASTWSSWMLGSVPTTLEEARVSSIEDPSTSSSTRSQVIHHRRGFWIDWSSTIGCHGDNDDDSADDCQFETCYGLQYAVKVPPPKTDHATRAIALNDVLPVPYYSTNDDRALLRSDPFADENVVRLLLGSSASQEFNWGPSCSMGDAATQSVSVSESLDRTEPCLILPTAVDGALAPIWSVNSNVLRASGQANRGALSVIVQNQHSVCASDVSVVQVIPAVLEPVWQSLTVVLENGETEEQILKWNELQDYNVDFREDGSFRLSFRHSLPQRSSLQVLLDYEPAFLSIESFPGDANRGFEIPPVRARFRVALDGSDACQQVLELTHGDPIDLYSNALLVLAPMPDMSMPFNVISLTCTLYAFVVGSLVNLLVKKASAQIKSKIDPKNAVPDGLKARIKAKLNKLFGKRLVAPPQASSDTVELSS